MLPGYDEPLCRERTRTVESKQHTWDLSTWPSTGHICAGIAPTIHGYFMAMPIQPSRVAWAAHRVALRRCSLHTSTLCPACSSGWAPAQAISLNKHALDLISVQTAANATPQMRGSENNLTHSRSFRGLVLFLRGQEHGRQPHQTMGYPKGNGEILGPTPKRPVHSAQGC